MLRCSGIAVATCCGRVCPLWLKLTIPGRVLATAGPLRQHARPQSLFADVRGVERITLVASDAGDGRDCDHANWGNPLFVSKKAEPKG
jgi:hypothetical protein